MTRPHIAIPTDHELTETQGGWKVTKRDDQRPTRTISMRITTEEANLMVPFAETFPSMSHAWRWLFDSPTVRELMAARVRGELQ